MIKVRNANLMTAKNGKPYKVLEVEWEGRKYTTNIFSNFLDFANIEAGYEIQGTMTKNDRGYWEIVSEAYQAPSKYTPRGGAYTKPQSDISASVKQAQDRTEKSITKVLDRKEESIRLSSAQRDSVLIVTEILKQTPFPTDAEIKKMIVEWRNWFLLSEEMNNPPPFE